MPMNRMLYDHQRALLFADHASSSDDRRSQGELASILAGRIDDWRNARGLHAFAKPRSSFGTPGDTK